MSFEALDEEDLAVSSLVNIHAREPSRLSAELRHQKNPLVRRWLGCFNQGVREG